MSRRNELLGLQSAAYTRALQYSASVEMRQHVRDALAASDNSEVSSKLAGGMDAAGQAFAQSEDGLAKGHELSSSALSASSQLLATKQSNANLATLELVSIGEKIQDELQVMQTLERGPFDYEGRYLRLRELYLNDLKSLISCVLNYFQAIFYINDPRVLLPKTLPDFKDPTYIWEVGPLLQRISSDLYSYRSRRIYRTIKVNVGFPGDHYFNDLGFHAANMTIDEWLKRLAGSEPVFFTADLPLSLFAARGWVNPRLEAFGIQWFDLMQNIELTRVPERNFTVACGVKPPVPEIPNHPASFVYFENASTTLAPEKDVQIEDGADLRGLKPFGRWEFTVEQFRRNGFPLPKRAALPPQDGGPTTPFVTGLLLHMRVSIDDFSAAPLGAR